MAATLKQLVDQMPVPDGKGLYSSIDKTVVDKTTAQLCAGGVASITGVIDMIVEPGKGDDVKARYALHCLAIHAKLTGQAAQMQYVQTLAAQLGGGRPKAVQQYLLQEIPYAGGKCVVPAIGKLLTDAALCESAAQALTAINDGAVEQFRAALGKVKGPCLTTVIQNLGVLRDAASAPAIRAATASENRETRLVAAWALANIGDADSVDAVLKVADAKEGSWERIEGTGACMLLAERLLACKNKPAAIKVYAHLCTTRTDASEKYLRDLADKALTAAGVA